VSYLGATNVVRLMYESELLRSHSTIACLRGVTNFELQKSFITKRHKRMGNPSVESMSDQALRETRERADATP